MLIVIVLFCWIIFCCFVRIIVDDSDFIIIIDVSSDTIFIIIFIDDVIFITIITYIKFSICIYISFKIIFNNSTVLIIDFMFVVLYISLCQIINLLKTSVLFWVKITHPYLAKSSKIVRKYLLLFMELVTGPTRSMCMRSKICFVLFVVGL